MGQSCADGDRCQEGDETHLMCARNVLVPQLETARETVAGRGAVAWPRPCWTTRRSRSTVVLRHPGELATCSSRCVTPAPARSRRRTAPHAPSPCAASNAGARAGTAAPAAHGPGVASAAGRSDWSPPWTGGEGRGAEPVNLVGSVAGLDRRVSRFLRGWVDPGGFGKGPRAQGRSEPAVLGTPCSSLPAAGRHPVGEPEHPNRCSR